MGVWYYIGMPKRGFTLVEILIVVAILGILVGIALTASTRSRDKADDGRVKDAVRQIRILAEAASGQQKGSFKNWSQEASVVTEIGQLKQIIDKHSGQSNATVIRDNQARDYCISAPLRNEQVYYCVDATGVFSNLENPCVVQADNGPALRCGP